MEFHLPDFDDSMVALGIVAVVVSIFFLVREEVRKRRNKKAREEFEQTTADIDEINRKKQ